MEPALLEFLTGRGNNLDTSGLDAEFARRLMTALQAAEAATGQRARINDLYRPTERQAQYYANYTQKPVTWQGVTYTPQRQGGLAAPPGQSRHGMGRAADIVQGAVLDWLHQNAGQYGLEFLTGDAFRKDPVHIQMSGAGPVNQLGQPTGETFPGLPEAPTGGSGTNVPAVFAAAMAQPPVPAAPAPAESGLARVFRGLGSLDMPAAGGDSGIAGGSDMGTAYMAANDARDRLKQTEMSLLPAAEASRTAPTPLEPAKPMSLAGREEAEFGPFGRFLSRPHPAKLAGGMRIRA